MKVYKGLPIIARKNNKEYDIANNETFIVKSVDTKTKAITITDDVEDKIIKFEDFAILFNPAYCITVHCPFTVFEWHKMDTKLKYTALTRVTKIDYLNII